MNIWNRPTRIPEIYGTLIFLGLIIYFFVMYAAGLIHVIELRIVNLFIMLGGVYGALKQFKRTHNGHMNYFRALATGTTAAVIGTSTFALFLFFFLKFEGNLMDSIRANEPLGPYLNPYIASFMVFLEGIFSGFGLTYLMVNWVETDHVAEPVGGTQ
jgi:hypothetical protein